MYVRPRKYSFGYLTALIHHSFINFLYGAGKFGKIWSTCGPCEILHTERSTNQFTYDFFFLLVLQPPMGVVFYSPLVGFNLLAYEVS